MCNVYTVWPRGDALWGPGPYVGCPERYRCDKIGQRRVEVRPDRHRDEAAVEREQEEHDRDYYAARAPDA